MGWKRYFKRGKNFSYKETLSIKGSQKIGKIRTFFRKIEPDKEVFILETRARTKE
jgi:hypothetical protein